jgi:hypothetical protein
MIPPLPPDVPRFTMIFAAKKVNDVLFRQSIDNCRYGYGDTGRADGDGQLAQDSAAVMFCALFQNTCFKVITASTKCTGSKMIKGLNIVNFLCVT